jgi:uncharacterized protein (DUF362 family)
LTTLTVVATGTAAIVKASEPFGFGNLIRWTGRDLAQELLAPPAVVALGNCPAYDDSLDCLREAWSAAVMPDVAGKRVLVKPNLIDMIEGHPATTDARLVGAVVDLLRELGAGEIAVGDGPGFRREAQPVANACGLTEILARRRTPFIDLNYDDPRPLPARDGWFRAERTLWLPRHVREADLIISVPKLKTHHWAGASLSLKNLFGLIPGCRYGWPKNLLHVNGIPASILGIYKSAPPVVAVVDGIVGMEGDGPLFGSAVAHGLLAVGANAAAVDQLCAQLMGFAVDEIDHLALAAATGLAQPHKIDVRGAEQAALQRNYRHPPKA